MPATLSSSSPALVYPPTPEAIKHGSFYQVSETGVNEGSLNDGVASTDGLSGQSAISDNQHRLQHQGSGADVNQKYADVNQKYAA